MSCTTICPTGKPGTDQEGRTYLYPNIGGRNVSPALIGLLGIVLFGGVIGTAKLTGYWQTAPKTLTDVVASDGQLDPANIKGFMTLKQVSETFHVELNALYAELGLTETQVPGDTPCKAIRSVLGVSESRVRHAKGAKCRRKNTGETCARPRITLTQACRGIRNIASP